MGSDASDSPNGPEKPVSYDKLIKAFIRRYPAAIGEWLFGERPVRAGQMETTHALAASRTCDKFLRFEFKSRPGVFLHFEVQLRGDGTMPARMTEIFGFSLAAILEAVNEGLQPASVVLYLDRRHYIEDPGHFDLIGDLSFRTFASYKVLKLWEISPEPILRMESPGLCPFVPLMRGKTEDLVLRSVDKIRKAPEGEATMADKRLLISVLRAFARRVMQNNEILEAILSEPEFYESDPLYKRGKREGKEEGKGEGRSEGRSEGLHEGEERAMREDIIDVLAARFGEVPEDVRARLAETHARDELKRLVSAAARAADLDAFRSAFSGGL